MNEEILQYIWNFKKFRDFDFLSSKGQKIEILDFGILNKNSGPDFLLSKLKIDGIIFVGNIELHIKASDWLLHNHNDNPEYSNIILHAVLINDCNIQELGVKNIPTLVLEKHIDPEVILKVKNLKNAQSFIACEAIFDTKKIPILFEEEVLTKKLDDKSESLQASLQRNLNNYEAVLFQSLAYNFGLTINAEIFLQLAESFDFSVIQKIKQNATQLEALLYGFCGFLDVTVDEMTKVWQREYNFLKVKYKLNELRIHPKYSKLRPPNFPNIRLSQLADLYNKEPNLFSKIIEANTIDDLYKLFKNVKATEYWDNRFNFGKISTIKKEKALSKDFVGLVIINTILPIKYFYHKAHHPEILDSVIEMYRQIKSEKNSVLEEWKKLGLKFENALQSQAFLYQYKSYCKTKKCLTCSIGFQLLKSDF